MHTTDTNTNPWEPLTHRAMALLRISILRPNQAIRTDLEQLRTEIEQLNANKQQESNTTIP